MSERTYSSWDGVPRCLRLPLSRRPGSVPSSRIVPRHRAEGCGLVRPARLPKMGALLETIPHDRLRDRQWVLQRRKGYRQIGRPRRRRDQAGAAG